MIKIDIFYNNPASIVVLIFKPFLFPLLRSPSDKYELRAKNALPYSRTLSKINKEQEELNKNYTERRIY